MDPSIQRILELLEATGMSDQGFIKAINATDKNLVFNWREEKTKSYKKYIVEIARLFKVSTDYLLCQTDIKDPISALLNEKEPSNPQSTKTNKSEDILVSDSNTKLLISLLNYFENEFDKIEFIVRAKKLAQDMRDEKVSDEPASKQSPNSKIV
ncbi:MAG: hypothetical protein FWC91_05410 [Defluviitaleaceae bacterium]|nr:hypothetical protein [Defluviitaleaceae bacterium]